MNKLDMLIEKLWNVDDSVWAFIFFMLPYFIVGCIVFGTIICGMLGIIE